MGCWGTGKGSSLSRGGKIYKDELIIGLIALDDEIYYKGFVLLSPF
jgi:hypothetical protein